MRREPGDETSILSILNIGTLASSPGHSHVFNVSDRGDLAGLGSQIWLHNHS